MTLSDFKDTKQLSYSALGKLLDCSKARAYHMCLGLGGDLKVQEINKIIEATEGLVTWNDLGLVTTTEVC